MMSSEHDPWSAFPPEVRQWFRSGPPSVSEDGEVAELLAELAPWISAGSISVNRESQSVFDLLEKRYPIGFNRIDWRGVRGHVFVDVLHIDSGQEMDFETQVEHLMQIRPTLEALIAPAIQAGDAHVSWVGDDYVLKLKMSLPVLLEIYVMLFTTPQHSYVVPEGYEWCLNYTMEGHLYFGYAKDSIVTGSVNLDDEDTPPRAMKNK